jgi:hypothetical protein
MARADLDIQNNDAATNKTAIPALPGQNTSSWPIPPSASALSPSSSAPQSPTVTAADKQAWIHSHRPSNPDLYCCYYASAEAAAKAGLPGKPELDSRYLCFECLSVEYADAEENVEDVEEQQVPDGMWKKLFDAQIAWARE